MIWFAGNSWKGGLPIEKKQIFSCSILTQLDFRDNQSTDRNPNLCLPACSAISSKKKHCRTSPYNFYAADVRSEEGDFIHQHQHGTISVLYIWDSDKGPCFLSFLGRVYYWTWCQKNCHYSCSDRDKIIIYLRSILTSDIIMIWIIKNWSPNRLNRNFIHLNR